MADMGLIVPMARWFAHVRWLLVGLAMGLVSPVWAAGEYTARFYDDLSGIEVQACFQGAVPRELRSFDIQAPGRLRAAESDQGHWRKSGSRLRIDKLPSDRCLQYEVDLSARRSGRGRTSLLRARDWLVSEPQIWLWLPVEDIGALTLKLIAPVGMKISAPWPQLPDGRYQLDARPLDWGGRVAVGHLEHWLLDVPGGALDIALLGNTRDRHRAKIQRWLRANVEAVSAVTGQFPVPRAQVLVAPLGRGGEPVPWGQVLRGGGDGVHLYIDETQSEEAFLSDWVLSHELSHLFHPLLSGDARWLSEGLASYLQYVSRARTGMLNSQQAWDALHAGFERGIRGTRKGVDLATTSENMRRDRSFMRVYWSGAAIFLLADLDLRKETAGRWDLPRALRGFSQCCLPMRRSWTSAQLMARLDAITGTEVFTRRLVMHVSDDRFPDLREAYQRLGIEKVDRFEVHFKTASRLRDAVMGP